jgi:hypothetical protein
VRECQTLVKHVFKKPVRRGCFIRFQFWSY